MKFAVIFVTVLAFAMAAPSTQENQNSKTIKRQAPDNSAGISTVNDPTARTLLGGQVASQVQQLSFPVVNRGVSRLANGGSISTLGQTGGDLLTFIDDSGEIIDDLDDLDDVAFISSVNSLPLVNRRPSNVRVASPSVFSTPVRSTVRQAQPQQPQFIQFQPSVSRQPQTTCTCPPAANTFSRFQPSSVAPARQLVQLMRFPQQQQTRFIQPAGSFFNMFNQNPFSGFQFVLDD